MSKMVKEMIHANGIDIGIYTEDFQNEYISITDIARYKSDEPKDVIKNWMRGKDTLEFLGLWEQLHNPYFKGVEFDSFRTQAGANAFTMFQNLKAKANAAQTVGELIQIATNKSASEDYKGKHGAQEKYGWYRYDTRLALPVYNDTGELQRYNIYKLRMLVRHDEDGKLYLYDFLRTKKETSSPFE